MAKFDDLAVPYMVNLIRDFDLLPFQAAGIVGNGGHESGGFEHIQEIHPTAGRGGLGHFQWTGDRRVKFEAWLARNADKNWQPDTFEANYSMLFRELTVGGPEHASLIAVKQTNSLDDATRVFCAKFERPGVIAMEPRLKYAARALAAFETSGINPAVLTEPKSEPHLPSTDALPHAPTDIIPTLLRILTVLQGLMNRSGDLSTMLTQLTVKTAEPPPSKLERPGVQLGVASFFAGLVAQLTGSVGPPQGLEHVVNVVNSPTIAGTLTTVLPIALAALSATGAPGAMAAGVLKIVGPLVAGWVESKKKQGKS